MELGQGRKTEMPGAQSCWRQKFSVTGDICRFRLVYFSLRIVARYVVSAGEGRIKEKGMKENLGFTPFIRYLFSVGPAFKIEDNRINLIILIMLCLYKSQQ